MFYCVFLVTGTLVLLLSISSIIPATGSLKGHMYLRKRIETAVAVDIRHRTYAMAIDSAFAKAIAKSFNSVMRAKVTDRNQDQRRQVEYWSR
jgi:hypothetical protein